MEKHTQSALIQWIFTIDRAMHFSGVATAKKRASLLPAVAPPTCEQTPVLSGDCDDYQRKSMMNSFLLLKSFFPLTRKAVACMQLQKNIQSATASGQDPLGRILMNWSISEVEEDGAL